MGDTKQNFIDRWTTTEGQLLLKAIVDFLVQGRPLDGIKGIQKVEDKFDLRGISFPKKYADYDYKGKHMHQVVGSVKFKNIRVENADFAYADLQQTEWKNCVLKNLKFNSTQMEQIRVTNCDFEMLDSITQDFLIHI